MNTNALNAAGEALKALGEQSVVLSFHAAGKYFLEDSYGVRLELDGSPGVHGSGRTVAEAYQAALNQRVLDEERIAIEAQIRAEVEERMAALGRKAAA